MKKHTFDKKRALISEITLELRSLKKEHEEDSHLDANEILSLIKNEVIDDELCFSSWLMMCDEWYTIVKELSFGDINEIEDIDEIDYIDKIEETIEDIRHHVLILYQDT